MEGAEVGITISPQDTQRRRDGASAGRQDGAGEQQRNVHPGRAGEQVGETREPGKEAWRERIGGASPTSSSLKTKLLPIKGMGCGLVTIWRLDPSVLWGDDVRGYRKVAIDLLDVGFWRGGVAEAQT